MERTFEIWHRVAIFSALATRGWRLLPPTAAGTYDVGESHTFVRGDQTLVLRISPKEGGAKRADVIATVEPGHRSYRLELRARDDDTWRAALRSWLEWVSRANVPKTDS